jgi:hypothetical protein
MKEFMIVKAAEAAEDEKIEAENYYFQEVLPSEIGEEWMIYDKNLAKKRYQKSDIGRFKNISSNMNNIIIAAFLDNTKDISYIEDIKKCLIENYVKIPKCFNKNYDKNDKKNDDKMLKAAEFKFILFENEDEFIDEKSGEITDFWGSIICIFDCSEEEKRNLMDKTLNKNSIFAAANFNRLYVMPGQAAALEAMKDSLESGYKSFFFIEKTS